MNNDWVTSKVDTYRKRHVPFGFKLKNTSTSRFVNPNWTTTEAGQHGIDMTIVLCWQRVTLLTVES
jgi:hypothetical protein